MWRSQSEGDVTCIACGDDVSRAQAREYDRYGDRWGARDRDFEFLCKPCHRECCHQPREGLEETLIRADAGHVDRATFLAQYHDVVTDGTASDKHDPERER